MDILPLSLALGALLLAPLLAQIAHRAPRWWVGLDGFVVTGLTGLVALTVLPHAVRGAGLGALAMAALGLLLPPLFERWQGHGHHQGSGHHQAVALVGLLAISLHALMDGGALAGHDRAGGAGLSLSVVMHRLPVAMAVWTRLSPRLAVPVLVCLGAATVAGFAVGQGTLDMFQQPTWGYFEALVGGTLMHVALEPAPGIPMERLRGWPAGIGGAAGIAVVVALVMSHDEFDHAAPALTEEAHLLDLALASAAPLILGLVVSAWLMRRRSRPISESTFWAKLRRGVLLAATSAPLPTGAPPATRLTWAACAPTLNATSLILSLALLGPWITCAVVALTILLGTSSAALLGRRGVGTTPPAPASSTSTLTWFGLGLIVAGWLEQGMGPGGPAALGPAALGILALAAGLLYLPPVATVPLAKMLLDHGAEPGLLVALLLLGPLVRLPAVVSLVRQRGAALALASTALVVAGALGAWLLLPPIAPWPAAQLASPLPEACLCLLALWGLALMVQRGPRALFAEVVEEILPRQPHRH